MLIRSGLESGLIFTFVSESALISISEKEIMDDERVCVMVRWMPNSPEPRQKQQPLIINSLPAKSNYIAPSAVQ